MVDCPECGLAFSGYKCKCGYKLPYQSGQAPVKTACSYAGCTENAITREFDNAALCRTHWNFRQDSRNARAIAALGLNDLEAKRYYLSKMSAVEFGIMDRSWAEKLVKDGKPVPFSVMELAKSVYKQ
jgi:hypothetical protein